MEVTNPPESAPEPASAKRVRKPHERRDKRTEFLAKTGQFKVGDRLPMVLNTDDMMRLFGIPSYRTFYRKVLEGEFARFELKLRENGRPLYSGTLVQRHLETRK
jgi:hypothetical protein